MKNIGIFKKITTSAHSQPASVRRREYEQTQVQAMRVRGFTLLEMLIVMAIFVTISSMILVRHSRFRGDALITNLAYEVALAIRSAQVYGLGVREVSGTGFVQGHGIHFDRTDPNSFFLFADVSTPPNNVWDEGTDTVIETFTLGAGNEIVNFCALGTPQNSCANPGGGEFAIDTLDVTFLRPDPEALILPDCFGGGSCTSNITDATFTIRSVHGAERTIVVSTAGQISVE